MSCTIAYFVKRYKFCEMEKIVFIVETTNTGLAAYAEDYDIYSAGADVGDLMKNILEATNLHFSEIDAAPVSAKDIALKPFGVE
jgi:hypothetical protein